MHHLQPKLAAVMAGLALAGAATALAGGTIRAAKVQGITIDGNVADWKDVPVQYFDSGPRVTAVAHDDRFLYVQFRFSDLALASRVLRTGAIVWVNGAGDHEAGFGLRYRGTPAAEQALAAARGSVDTPAAGLPGGPDGMPGGGGPPPERGMATGRAPLGALEILHLGVVDDVITSGAAPDGPAASCAVTDGVFAYELRVPLAEIALVGAGAGAGGNAAGEPVTVAVGFQMSGMTAAERDAMRERMRSGGGADVSRVDLSPSGTGTWHRIGVAVRAQDIEMWLDGKKRADHVAVGRMNMAGNFGVWQQNSKVEIRLLRSGAL